MSRWERPPRCNEKDYTSLQEATITRTVFGDGNTLALYILRIMKSITQALHAPLPAFAVMFPIFCSTATPFGPPFAYVR